MNIQAVASFKDKDIILRIEDDGFIIVKHMTKSEAEKLHKALSRELMILDDWNDNE